MSRELPTVKVERETNSPRVPTTVETAREYVLLNGAEAAGVLRMSPATLRWWARPNVRRGPPFIRVGSRTRYRLSDLLKYLEEKTVRPERGAAPRVAEILQ
ncbi:MAG: helix-turn-helix domain-containing protein [Terriglobia bacterium]|jgi:hypothetical protein